MGQQSIIILALLNEFVYEHRGNNTYVIQEKTALIFLAKTYKSTDKILQNWPQCYVRYSVSLCPCTQIAAARDFMIESALLKYRKPMIGLGF